LDINFSVGVAAAGDETDAAVTLLDRADARLLAGKRAGRGRTIGDG
jgi:PleD family two-component response regulator